MARNNKQFKLDATRPFYAGVGVVDFAVELARATATDVQTRLSKVDLEPKALRDQARTVVGSRVDELAEEATETYGDLAARGQDLVARIRRQQATQDTKAAGNTTVAKAKTTKTQTTKSADRSTATAKGAATRAANSTRTAAKTSTTAAKNTGNTAKRNVKGTGTSAKKTASAAARATSDGAAKVGN